MDLGRRDTGDQLRIDIGDEIAEVVDRDDDTVDDASLDQRVHLPTQAPGSPDVHPSRSARSGRQRLRSDRRKVIAAMKVALGVRTPKCARRAAVSFTMVAPGLDQRQARAARYLAQETHGRLQ